MQLSEVREAAVRAMRARPWNEIKPYDGEELVRLVLHRMSQSEREGYESLSRLGRASISASLERAKREWADYVRTGKAPGRRR